MPTRGKRLRNVHIVTQRWVQEQTKTRDGTVQPEYCKGMKKKNLPGDLSVCDAVTALFHEVHVGQSS